MKGFKEWWQDDSPDQSLCMWDAVFSMFVVGMFFVAANLLVMIAETKTI